MWVEEDWSYYECLEHIVFIKKDYDDFMHFFYVDEYKWYYYNKMRELKKEIYKLKFEEWKRDKLWEYLNGDVTYLDLLSFL